jgi:hypothetical protein
MNRSTVIKSPFALVIAILVLGPVGGLWPFWVSLVVALAILLLALVLRQADIE